MKYKVQLGQTNKLLKEMLDVQCQFQSEMDIHDTIVKVLLLHAHNLISEDPHHGMELDIAQAMIEVLGYQRVGDGESLQVCAMPGTRKGQEWLLQPNLQPTLERRFQQLLRISKDVATKAEEIKPPTLSRFTDEQMDYFHKILQSDMQATMSTVPEPTPSTSMEVSEPWKSYIYDMYEQSFHATEEDMGTIFMDNFDKEQTPVKTAPSADEMEA